MKRLRATLPCLAILFLLFFPKTTQAQSVDIRDYIAGPDFVPHQLSTGESVSFTGEGGDGPGTPVRQYKNSNYEQFFVADTVYRREDTSWAPLPGFGDALCSNGNKAVYLLDPGCTAYQEGQSFSSDGARWGPPSPYISVGHTWTQETHQIVTIDSSALSDLKYCSLSNLSGYSHPLACGQTPGLTFTSYYEPGEYTFCTGITNQEPMIALSGSSGAGSGDQFLYMRGWGLVGFEAPGFQAGLMGEGADPSNCRGGGSGFIPSTGLTLLPPSSGQPPAAPKPPIDYTACNQTRNPEFHSLRPYPASPCDYPNTVWTETKMCSEDLTVKEIFQVLPGDANGGCIRTSQTTQVCTYNIESSIDYYVFAGLTRLPIVGNTELVPNSVSSENQLSNATRMNEYASWYLNGVTSRAEEEDEFLQPELRVPPLTSSDISNRINEVVNFSGPIKKLLPYAVQNNEVNFILGGIQNPGDRFSIDGLREQQKLNAEDGTIRHNQIVVCTSSSSPNFPIPCYNSGRFEYRRSLLSSEMDYFWLDRINPAFSYIPFSSTEDTTGEIGLSFKSYSGSITFTGAPSVNLPPTSRLFFPHMIEVNELANTLQKTFTSSDFISYDGGYSTNEGETPESSGIVRYGNPPLDQYNEQRSAENCTIQTTRRNPGDLLYGGWDVENGVHVDRNANAGGQRGDLSYSGSFTCEFPIQEPDPACINTCLADVDCYTSCEVGTTPSDCAIQRCQPPEVLPCTQFVEMTFDVESSTPLSESLWDRLVAGSYSVFKRMFPQVSPDAPVEEILDIPAEDSLWYSASNTSSNLPRAGTEPIAGDPVELRPGSDAKAYFPHIGSVHEYFLQGIQCALRPFGMCGNSGFSSGTTPLSPNPTEEGEVLQHLYQPTCEGQECYEFIVDQASSQARCNGNYFNPYVAIAIALNESGGLVSNMADGSNVKHFGCDPYDVLGIGYTPAEKFRCMINTFANDCSKPEAEALSEYGYSPTHNLNSIIEILGLPPVVLPNGYTFNLWVDGQTAQRYAAELKNTLPEQEDLWRRYYQGYIDDYSN